MKLYSEVHSSDLLRKRSLLSLLVLFLFFGLSDVVTGFVGGSGM